VKPAYYNEFDPKAAAWLRELIKARLIADGDVDERSIADVRPADLRGFSQCHFFAGIGGWSYALRLAGVSDDDPVWTGSCPCQDFSSAGKQEGIGASRDLWPDFWRLIRECAPYRVFGEQVANSIGFGWIDRVRADVETKDYALGIAVLGAHSVGAPQIRQRLCWVAYTQSERERSGQSRRDSEDRIVLAGPESRRDGRNNSSSGGLAQSDGRNTGDGHLQRSREYGQQPQDAGNGIGGKIEPARHETRMPQPAGRSASGFWSAFDILHCTDNRARRIEPGTFPLAHGIPARVGRLRGYGNAIVPQAAAAFVEACMTEDAA
jgi:DNA (cytosine-5)-methyltransferase 1